MKTTTFTPPEMARTSQDFSSSSKRHHFPWPNSSSNKIRNDDVSDEHTSPAEHPPPPTLSKSSSTKKPRSVALSKIRAAFLTALLLSKNRAGAGAIPSRSPQLPLLGSGCRRAVGTLFGRRRGHVQFALQRDAASHPAFFVELSTPIGSLVKEMASGLVRIALECDKNGGDGGSTRSRGVRLLEEPAWRAYCNGRKCGFATRKVCGEKEQRILKAIEPISMGAGVLPRVEVDEDGNGKEDEDGDGDMMYMRAKFERIIGSRDCEAYYMMNPDCNGAPELSIYLLRV